MLRILRYGIAFSRVLWFQTQVPTRVWHFLCFWFLKEVRPQDIDVDRIDKKQQFPIDTLMEYEGRVYRYWKADRDYKKGEVVREKDHA